MIRVAVTELNNSIMSEEIRPTSHVITPAASSFSKPSLSSRIAAESSTCSTTTTTTLGTKRILVDEEGRKRGKRMLGVLVGTLTRFNTEASQPKPTDQRRQELEARLAARLAEEKARLAEQLETEQAERRKQADLARREREIQAERVRAERRRHQRLDEACFLSTITEPRLFWLPVELDQATNSIIEQQKLVAIQEADKEDTLESDDNTASAMIIDSIHPPHE